MIRICVVCEGQTEVEFVKTCLAPFLLTNKLSIFPSLLQSPSGNHRGGRVSVERLARFISHQYHQADRITTLVDFYGFQDANGRSRAQLEADIRASVAAKTAGYDTRFFLPYVQMYEFEGLLFTDPKAFEWVEDGWSDKAKQALENVASAFTTPEDINNSHETAPSKRILKIFPEGSYSYPMRTPHSFGRDYGTSGFAQGLA